MYASRDQRLILLVDDDDAFHRDFAAMLPPGYRLLSAYNPSDALRLIKIESPYVVLLDLRLTPESSEYEYSVALELMHEISGGPHGDVPIIVLIDSDISHALVDHIMMLAKGIVKKPREIKALLDQMERCLAGQ